MDLIDVTLRDGGFTCDFDWPIKFARNYYKDISPHVKYVELGYWGQTVKSNGPFYDLDIDFVKTATGNAEKNNVSVMIDYHYCSKVFTDYPKKNSQKEIGLIRLCSRKEDVKDAANFLQHLKSYTGLKVSLNIFNVTNYTQQELRAVEVTVAGYKFDYVYFADTHGNLNLNDPDCNMPMFRRIADACRAKMGLHFHNHLGLALSNYLYCKQLSLSEQSRFGETANISDVSLGGLGKGGGNLKTEDVMALKEDDFITPLLFKDFIYKYPDLFKLRENSYERITAKAGITDNYAAAIRRVLKGKLRAISLFYVFCTYSVSGVDRDVFNKRLFDKHFPEGR